MPVTDLMRTQIRGCLNGLMGEEMSDIMMELLPPAGWGDVVRRQDVSSMHVELRMELVSTRHSLSRQIADLRTDMRLGFAAIDTQASGHRDRERLGGGDVCLRVLLLARECARLSLGHGHQLASADPAAGTLH